MIVTAISELKTLCRLKIFYRLVLSFGDLILIAECAFGIDGSQKVACTLV